MHPFRDTDPQCPRCGKPLARYADRDKWRCRACNGVLVGKDQLVVEIGPHATTVLDGETDPARQALHPCPACAYPMTPYTIGGAGGVELDRCVADQLVWFDGGELGKVRAAVPAENDDAPLLDDTLGFLRKAMADDLEASYAPIPRAEPQAPMTSGEWKARTLCRDDSCNGVIGEDGRCGTCGKAA